MTHIHSVLVMAKNSHGDLYFAGRVPNLINIKRLLIPENPCLFNAKRLRFLKTLVSKPFVSLIAFG